MASYVKYMMNSENQQLKNPIQLENGKTHKHWEDRLIANMHMKRYSISLATREMQIKPKRDIATFL